MKTLIAQTLNISGTPIEGPLKGPGGVPIEKLSDVINVILPFLYKFAGILLFFYMVRGAFQILTARNDPEKVNLGRTKIISAVVGFLLLVVSFLLVRVIALIFGLKESLF